MKLDRLETHDRLGEFKKQADYISQGCVDCINNRPAEFGNLPFYIFAHMREIGEDERRSLLMEDVAIALQDPLKMRRFTRIEDVPTGRLIWSPRLVKPKAQTNSMLFKAYPPGDNIKIIWIIPDRALWGQYKKGNLTEMDEVGRSIYQFENEREKLEAKEDDDLDDARASFIYAQISSNRSGRGL